MSETGPRLICLLLCASLIFSAGAGCKPKTVSPAELETLARQFAGYLSSGAAADAVKMMNATTANAMPADKLAELWPSLVAQLGPYSSVAATRYTDEDGYRVVYVTLAFGPTRIDMKVVFDSSAKVAGLWFGQPSTSEEYAPPAYADQAAFAETEVTVQSGTISLPGTLTIPAGAGPFPAVVLVHGSGPNDRNETIGPNRPFQDLAWGLASRGIVVLRYEKRTRQYQGQISDPAGFTVDDETVTDAVAAVRLLQATAKVSPDRVYVLGHSLGGMLAPRIATRTAEAAGRPAAGIVMMAANARDLLSVMLEQVEYLARLDGTFSPVEQAQLQDLRTQVDRIRSGSLTAQELVLGAGKAYWTDLLAYNQVATAKALDTPLLLLQGERDYQVTMVDFAAWQQALAERPKATLKSYPALNHLMIAGEGPAGPAEYQQPGNVARAVVDDIAAWIGGR